MSPRLLRTSLNPLRGAIVIAMVGLVAWAPVGRGSASPASLSKGTVYYGFNKPSAIAVAGNHLWIANRGGNSLTETRPSGAWVRTLAAKRFGFDQPVALARAGHRLLVVNRVGSVTELNASTGKLIRVVGGHRYGFNHPTAITTGAGNVWVANRAGDSVTEFAANTGALIRVVRNPSGRLRFDSPIAITQARDAIWVVNSTGGSTTDPSLGSLTELRARDGAFRRNLHAGRLGLKSPAGIGFDGRHLWVSDSASDTVTELTSGGHLVQIITNQSGNHNYGFDGPNVIATGGGYVYVNSPLSASPMVTQINPKTTDGDWFECNTNAPTPGWLNPTGVAIQGSHVWVIGAAVEGGSVLVELDASPSGSNAGQVIHRFLG